MTAMTWSLTLWETAMRPAFDAVLEHPFLRGVADGTLPEACFRSYLVQDTHYLDEFARALAGLAGRATDPRHTALLARRAAGVADVELALHRALLDELGIAPGLVAATPLSPTTHAYTRHLLAAAHAGENAVGLAAVLPCFWIYARVGAELARQGSPDPRYQRWIDAYGGEEFDAVVATVLALVDEVGDGLSPGTARRAQHACRTSARYEWMFWDAAWRQEEWPV